MPRAFPSFTLFAAIAILAGCSSTKSSPETASASTPAAGSPSGTDSATTAARTGTVPLTTASAEARDLYLRGRTLAEQLRFQDGRKLFEQATAKDPSFAMAHYQLAVTSATAKDFFAHLKEAVALSDKASEGER
ncbi:MAG TPA: hypothetical protein VK688_10480, partial [Gemmatimonadales bacterium]|nr:hypothetical protein [Gemmatimonadales bacterium]